MTVLYFYSYSHDKTVLDIRFTTLAILLLTVPKCFLLAKSTLNNFHELEDLQCVHLSLL